MPVCFPLRFARERSPCQRHVLPRLCPSVRKLQVIVRHSSRLLRIHLPIEDANQGLRNVANNPATTRGSDNQSRHAAPVKDDGWCH